MGLLPGLLIYVVSYQFVSRSIESWFDVKVEGALSAGVSLARVTLDTIASDMAMQTRTASSQLAQVPDAAAGVVLERIRDQLGASDVVLFSTAGQPVASAGQSRFDLSPERPSAQLLRNARQQRATFQIEGLDDIADPAAVQNARVKTLVAVGNASVGLLVEPRYLQATLRLPQVLVSNAIAVQEANREYQERALAREGLRRMYIGTLTLSLFLAVFGAVLLAVLLGRQLARPLLVLAEGVREVASGNLSPKAVLQGNDELGGLTRSFAVMTQQLSDARTAVEHSMGEVDAARAHLQTILDNLTAGVIVLDAEGASAPPTPAPPASCGPRWPPSKAGRWPTCPGWPNSPVPCRATSRPSWATASSMGWTTGSIPSIFTARPPRAWPPTAPAWWPGGGAAQRVAPSGFRRHLRNRLGPACTGLGRSRPAPGP